MGAPVSSHPATTAPAAARLAACPVYLVLSTTPGDFEARVRAARSAAAVLLADAGAVAVQLRAKDADGAARRRLLVRLRSELPAGTLLLVNDDLAAVREPGGAALADGLHLG
ncbi:MAG: hypothetical protein FJ296_04160, partial [Planctomycetes bacterium]|nr:hypothetical protein [Planctomycetota bacterium]